MSDPMPSDVLEATKVEWMQEQQRAWEHVIRLLDGLEELDTDSPQ